MEYSNKSYNTEHKYDSVEIIYSPQLSGGKMKDLWVLHFHRTETRTRDVFETKKILFFFKKKVFKETITETVHVIDALLHPNYNTATYLTFDSLGEAENIARKCMSRYTLKAENIETNA